MQPPVLGRPSSASTHPARLRTLAGAGDAAYRADGGDAGGLAVRAATVAGVRHRLAGRPGEDSYGWAAGDGWVVAAVADGVSASEGAVAASAAAVAAALAAGAEAMEASGGGAPAEATRAAVAAAGAGLAAMPGTGATTLVVSAVTASGAWAAARVGDSSAFVLCGRRWRESFATPVEDGGPALTATVALPAAGAGDVEVAGGALGEGAALVLMTDGVAGPLRDGPETVAPALAGALASPPAPLTLASITDFSRQGCHDDRTILGVWRLAAEG